jgi:hypothetical protein
MAADIFWNSISKHNKTIKIAAATKTTKSS